MRLTRGKGTNPARSGESGSMLRRAWHSLRRRPLFYICVAIIAIFAIMSVAPQLFTSIDPYHCPLRESRQSPSAEHWFGTDLQGCDYYARSIYGVRASMTVGFFVVIIAGTAAVIIGQIAGYYGGIIDSIISRIVDTWFAVPSTLGAIVVLSLLTNRGLTEVTIVLVIFNVPTMLRLMRSSTLRIKHLEYVEAARAIGARDFRVLRYHITPNAIAPVITFASIAMGIVMLAEAALTFLGVGLQPPTISWGLMISQAQRFILTDPYLLIFPGLLLSMLVFSFIVLGDLLRDAFDPQTSRAVERQTRV